MTGCGDSCLSNQSLYFLRIPGLDALLRPNSHSGYVLGCGAQFRYGLTVCTIQIFFSFTEIIKLLQEAVEQRRERKYLAELLILCFLTLRNEYLSPASDLHSVPGVLFECMITVLHTISGPAKDFHLGLDSHKSTSCSDGEATEKNTQNGSKKCVCSPPSIILDKPCACILPSRYNCNYIWCLTLHVKHRNQRFSFFDPFISA